MPLDEFLNDHDYDLTVDLINRHIEFKGLGQSENNDQAVERARDLL